MTEQAKLRRKSNKVYADRLETQRIKLNLTKTEISKFCGVAYLTASNWLDGSSKPSSDNISKLAVILKLTPEFILHGTTYADSKKFNGIHPDIIEKSVKIVRGSELFSGQLYTAKELSDKIIEVCYRLTNNDEVIELVPERSLTSEAAKLFAKEIKGLKGVVDEKMINSMLNDAYLKALG